VLEKYDKYEIRPETDKDANIRRRFPALDQLLGLNATTASLRRMDDLNAAALLIGRINLYRSVIIPALSDFR
jgi:hypothetical protein